MTKNKKVTETVILLHIILLSNNLQLFGFDLSDISYKGDQGVINFIGSDKLHIYGYLENNETVSDIISNYRIEYIDKIPFLFFGEALETKMLFLYSKYFVFTATNENRPFISGFVQGSKLYDWIEYSGTVYSASSFLCESGINYGPENLGFFGCSRPWIEGVEGYGIGQKITIKKHIEFIGGIRILLFSNGFVSYDKPYLYEKNSRVKSIRIVDMGGEFDFTVELEDTPNPQLIYLPRESDSIVIEIIDIYKGTQWADTCINFIMGIPEKLSEYFDDEDVSKIK